MSESAIRAQVKTIIEGVAGAGTCYSYEVYAEDLRRLRALCTSSSKLNVVTITRESTRTIERTNVQVERQHRFVVRWFYALDAEGASETTFQALLEAAFTAFLNDYTLGGTCETSTPLQIESVRPVMFAGVLVHRAEMSIEAHELL